MGYVIDLLHYFMEHPGIFFVLFLMYVFVFCLSLFFSGAKPGRNPFRTDTRKTPKPLVTDQTARDRVLKQGFAAKKVPNKLDAIVIGSGIGGLGAAAMLSKAGKKVLVLEQHDQAGGCCHTFIEKGFEFDIGIHYIGEMRNNTVSKLLVEQVTNGQLCWEDLCDDLDIVAIGEPGKQKMYPFRCAGKAKWKAAMLEKFPDEEKALDKFLYLLNEVRNNMIGQMLLKTQSRWIGRFLINTGLLSIVTKFFKYSNRTVKDVLEELTDNKDLRAVLAYPWGDYGTPPSRSSFAEHATLISHYLYGGSYPRGGASEIAFHIIPVIEDKGGRVYVRAPVSQILFKNGKACGVRVSKSSGDVDVYAPLIISDAGMINTFTKLLPKEVADKSSMPRFMKKKKLDSGIGAIQLFVGLKGTTEELGLKPQNVWSYTSNEANSFITEYYNKSRDEILDSDVHIPLMFISFPSAKDSTWESRFPGKSVSTIVTLGNWEWFKEWEHERVQKRGSEYETYKQAIGKKMWQQALTMFPQLEDKVEYFEVGTPVTNTYYLASPKGEIYGIDHSLTRFGDPEVVMNLRPDTDIPGLLFTGQDVLSCGFMGALYGSLLCASKALNRNLYKDLLKLKAHCNKNK